MPYLTYLNLCTVFSKVDGNKWVTDSVVKKIPNTRNFQHLNLGRTSISDESLKDIGEMLHLKSLCLDCNNLNGLAVAHLAKSISEV